MRTLVYLDNMSISIHSECIFFESGLQHLIDECDFLQKSLNVQLCIVFVRKIHNSMSLIKFLLNDTFDFPLNRDRIIIACPGGVAYGSELSGIMIVNSSMSLNEWRRSIIQCAEEIRNEENSLPLYNFFYQQKISQIEMQLLSCMRLNMSPSEIASIQKVCIKTMYSRISAIRKKYLLGSTRDLYLNANYIYENIMQYSGDNV